MNSSISSASPVDREWHAVRERQLKHLSQISPLLLATTWLFFLCHHVPLFLTHSLSRLLSPSLLPGNQAHKCDPTCLRLAQERG